MKSPILMKTITTAIAAVTFAFSGFAAAADDYDLTGTCSVPSFGVADKCGLSLTLFHDPTKPVSLKKTILRVNGKPVHITYNDKTPLLVNSFSSFSSANIIPVTCGKTYTVSAAVIKSTSNAETKVGEPQAIVCPAKAVF